VDTQLKLRVIKDSLSINNNKIIFDQLYAKQKGLPAETIYLIKEKLREENSKEIKASSIEQFIFPIIVWAIDSLHSYLLKELFSLGISSFCRIYENENKVTGLLCSELNTK